MDLRRKKNREEQRNNSAETTADQQAQKPTPSNISFDESWILQGCLAFIHKGFAAVALTVIYLLIVVALAMSPRYGIALVFAGLGFFINQILGNPQYGIMYNLVSLGVPFLTFVIVFYRLLGTTGDMRLKLVLADYLMIGFTILYALSTLISPDSSGLLLAARFLLFTTLYYFAIRFGTTKSIRCAEDILAGYAMAATFIGVFALARGAGVGEWVTRLMLGSGDTIVLSRIMAIGSYMLVYFIFVERKSFLGFKTPKLVNYIAFLVCSYGLVACQTRSAVLGFVVAVAFTFIVTAIWSDRKATFVFSFIVGFGALMAGLFYYLAQHPEAWDRLYSTTMAVTSGEKVDRSAGSRIVSWAMAIEIFQREPFFGVGAGGFNYLTGRWYPHNVILEALCELGILGGLILVSFIVAVFRKIKLVRQPLYLACYSAMILSGISMQFSGNLTMQRHFFVSAALVVTLAQAINVGYFNEITRYPKIDGYRSV